MLLNPLSLRALIFSGTAVLLFLLTIGAYTSSSTRSSTGQIFSKLRTQNTWRTNTHAENARNRTLGFEKIFTIGFPGRGDRHDTLAVASSLTDIEFEWSDAVSFSDMPAKSIHENWNEKDLNNTGIQSLIGSQRAHFNVLDKIISNHISTALIFEDDNDWDYHLKDQVEALATAFRGLQEQTTGSPTQNTPYGDHWDILWLGHCRSGPNDNDEQIYLLRNDPTVPPLTKRHSNWAQTHIPDPLLDPNTRLAFKLYRGICTFAYAVTNRGAQKILTSLSLQGNTQPFDSAMNDLCRGALKPQLACYGVYPPIFATHRAAGSLAKDSDISSYKTTQRHAEYTWDIVYSVIQNAARLLAGETTVKSQWPGLTAADEMRVGQGVEYEIVPTRVRWKELPVVTDHVVQVPHFMWTPEPVGESGGMG